MKQPRFTPKLHCLVVEIVAKEQKWITKAVRRLLLALAILLVGGATQADVISISQTLGTQEVADGTTPVFSSDFTNPDPAPYNIVFGSDRDGTFGDITLSHDLGEISDPIVSAVFTIGLVDHDSFNTGQDTIDIFFCGIQQDDSPFLGISVSPSSASVVSMAVDPSLVLDGMLEINVVATQAAQGFSGNSLLVDFSTLTIDTIPEPSTALLLAFGLVGLTAARIRR